MVFSLKIVCSDTTELRIAIAKLLSERLETNCGGTLHELANSNIYDYDFMQTSDVYAKNPDIVPSDIIRDMEDKIFLDK